VAVDEQSRVTGEAISLVQPVSRADDARWSVHTPRTVYSRRDTSDASYYGDIAEPPPAFIGSGRKPRELPRDDDSDVVRFLKATDLVKMILMASLAEGPHPQECADLLAALEELLQILSRPATNRNDQVMAACLLTMMVACMVQGPERPTLPKALAGLDLSPSGEPWKRWMTTLKKARNDPAWQLMVPALESGDLNAIAKATDAATLLVSKSRQRWT
jgi:AcrR family transcriptional regulator